MRDDYQHDDAKAIAGLEKDVKELRQRVADLEKLCRELDTRTIDQVRLGPASRSRWDESSPYDLLTVHNRARKKR